MIRVSSQEIEARRKMKKENLKTKELIIRATRLKENSVQHYR
jgi:hypothetical protein